MGKITRFEDLVAWSEARKLLRLVIGACRTSPMNKEYALIDQIKRSSISIMANIAEGFGRYGLKDSKQFYVTARGSIAETQSHLYVMKDLSCIDDEGFRQLYCQTVVVYKLINGLISNTVNRLDEQRAEQKR